MKNLILCFIAISFAFSAEARESQYWSSVKLSSKLDDKLTMLGELLHRYSEDDDKYTTRSVRLGLGYTFENEMQYALIFENRTAGSDASDEARYIHQLSYKLPYDGWNLGLRGRWENREFSNTSSFANRLRARVKVDAPMYTWHELTPFALAEYFYQANSVVGRPEGSTELRLQAGASYPIWGGKLALSYLDRSTKKPAYQGAAKSESDYGIIDLALSWKY
tara:strand:- start:4812 stop:5474 length:663 start_codon:yes stop_codon:yes gene_type:complete